jgi:hypothetical protein
LPRIKHSNTSAARAGRRESIRARASYFDEEWHSAAYQAPARREAVE